MSEFLHITSGDNAGGLLLKAELPGDVFVWHDVLYDGPRHAGWPTAETLAARASFLESMTGGGLDRAHVLDTLERQYAVLARAGEFDSIVLWFDACLFDQAMLAHILTCLAGKRREGVELLCVDAYPGIDPYHGLGQLTSEQLSGKFIDRVRVTDAQFGYASAVDAAFAEQDLGLLAKLGEEEGAPLPWVPAAARRWLAEQPDPVTGLGRLESLALAAIRSGCGTPAAVFTAVSAAETPPQYWGDTMLWAVVNRLADRTPPLVSVQGPLPRLPQWECAFDLNSFRLGAL